MAPIIYKIDARADGNCMFMMQEEVRRMEYLVKECVKDAGDVVRRLTGHGEVAQQRGVEVAPEHREGRLVAVLGAVENPGEVFADHTRKYASSDARLSRFSQPLWRGIRLMQRPPAVDLGQWPSRLR